MDILLCESIRDTNEYREQLAKTYQCKGHRVIFDVQNFLYSDFLPDFVHIQWPENIYRWSHKLPTNNDTLEFIKQRLLWYSNRKVPIVYTAHNLLPHGNVSAFDKAVFNTILGHANIIVHHGKMSIPLIKKTFPVCSETHHIVCPHGPYTYKSEDGWTTRAAYGLPTSKYIFLNFGRQHPYKGFKFMQQVFKKWNDRKSLLFNIGPKVIAGLNNAFLEKAYLIKQNIIDPHLSVFASRFSTGSKFVFRPIGKNEIPKIISAADVFFLGHQDGLNSGLVALAATYGKPIVFPDLGNFSEQLSRWVWKEKYEPGKIDSAIEALQRMRDRIDLYPPGHVIFDNKEWLFSNSWEKHVRIIIEEVQKFYK